MGVLFLNCLCMQSETEMKMLEVQSDLYLMLCYTPNIATALGICREVHLLWIISHNRRKQVLRFTFLDWRAVWLPRQCTEASRAVECGCHTVIRACMGAGFSDAAQCAGNSVLCFFWFILNSISACISINNVLNRERSTGIMRSFNIQYRLVKHWS